MNQDYRIPEEQDTDQPLEPNDIDHEPEVLYDILEDINPLQNPQEHLNPIYLSLRNQLSFFKRTYPAPPSVCELL